MKKNKMKIRKQRFLLLLAGMLFSCAGYAQNVFTVTDEEDHVSGGGLPGQLRWAVESANAATGESVINFNIPGTGPIIVEVHATLPVITKSVTIDGTTQPGYDPNDPASPMIIIDGSDHGNGPITTGISFSCERSKVVGVGMQNFNHGIVLTSCKYCEIRNNVINLINYNPVHLVGSHFNVIKGNYINTDKTRLQLSMQSTEGIFLQSSNDNIIGGIDCNEKNVVAYVLSEGIDTYWAEGQRNKYSGNLLFENDISFSFDDEIQLRGSGNGGKARPVITSTAGCFVSGTTSKANDVIEVFGGTGPVNTRKNAKVYMGTTRADKSGKWSLPVSNITYSFVTATATDSINNSSDLALNKPIVPDPLVASIIKPQTICAHEKITFENPTKCKNGGDMIWDFGDGSPSSTSSSHVYAAAGNYTVKLSLYDKNSCTGVPIATTSSAIAVTTCPEFDCANTSCENSGLSVAIGYPHVPIYDGGFNPSYFAFSAIPTGGAQPYTFLWYNASSNILPLKNTTSQQVLGTYTPLATPISITVKVTDKNGCEATANYYYDPN